MQPKPVLKRVPTQGDLIQIQLWEQKAEEVNIFLVISTLVFGFSVTLFFEFDRSVFIDKEITLNLFTIALACTIIGSLWSTVATAGSLVLVRGHLQQNETAVVSEIFERTLGIRLRSRIYCYTAFVSLLFALLNGG
mmetsp:Transcript_88039/g.107833  ORF Transcript_88039/g.107833 Transcript_88039/m.107833 type:complete len:136 (+) Transcript_88039:51-458(+)